MKRDKREKFIELTEKRVTKTLDSIRLIGNLSDKRYKLKIVKSGIIIANKYNALFATFLILSLCK